MAQVIFEDSVDLTCVPVQDFVVVGCRGLWRGVRGGAVAGF